MRPAVRTALTVGSGIVAAALSASAQSPQDMATRRTLISHAQQLSDRGNHAAALESADRAGRIQMTPSLRLFIAQEQESLGQIAEAFGSADLCVREAQRDAAASNRVEIQRECQALVTHLQGRVGFVTVQLGAGAPSGLAVLVNRQPLNPAIYNSPYAVTPGFVAIDASAPGMIAFHQSVGVRAGQTQEVRVVLRADPNAARATGGPVGPAVVVPPVVTYRARRLEPLHAVLIFGGGALALAGGVMGVVNLAMNAQFQGTSVARDRAGLQDTGDVMAWGADLGLGIGLVSAGLGLILFLAQDTRERGPAASTAAVPAWRF